MFARWGMIGLCLPALLCGGCIIGLKPAAPTVLRLRAEPAVAAPGHEVEFGIEDMIWEPLQRGYGVGGSSTHPRAHETYFYLGYDHDRVWTDAGRRILLLWPAETKPGQPSQYQLELLLPARLLAVGVTDAEPAVCLSGTINGPFRQEGDRLVIECRDVPLTGAGPPFRRLLLSGRIVAEKCPPGDFEQRVAAWRQRLPQGVQP